MWLPLLTSAALFMPWHLCQLLLLLVLTLLLQDRLQELGKEDEVVPGLAGGAQGLLLLVPREK